MVAWYPKIVSGSVQGRPKRSVRGLLPPSPDLHVHRDATEAGHIALKTAKMKADEEHLLADNSSHHGSLVASLALTRGQQKREKRCNVTGCFVCGIAVTFSLLVVLCCFTGHLSLLSNDGKSNPPPRRNSHAFVEHFEIEVARWTETAEEISGKIRPDVKLTQSSPDQTVASCGATESDRFDCWPEVLSASQEKCIKRGCCWSPSLQTGVPYCFYPDNFVSYAATSSLSSNSGMTVKLERKAPSPYPNDVLELQVDVIYETETTVRFRIFDPNNKRYEVPLNLSSSQSPPAKTDYNITLQSSPFGILISRKSTGVVLFDSRKMAPLVFADQFIQIGTRLSTPNVYGLGEHQASLRLDVNWKRLVLWNRDESPDGGGNLYGSHPFYLNLEEGGNAHGVFLLNSNAMEIALQPYAGGQGSLTYRTLGGILDFYVFSGPSPLQVVEQYVSLIGRPAMPPFWSLGFHLCRYGYSSTKHLTEVIERNRAAKIPYDVQWNDIDYMSAYKDWTYDSNGSYAGLDKLVDDLHSHNQRYVMIIDPGISSVQAPGTYPPYDQGVQMDIFMKNATGQILVGKVWPGNTAFPDFFHPNADQYWFNQMKSYYAEVKFDGIWIDMNEASNFVDGSTLGCTSGPLDNPPYTPPGVNGKTLASRTICPSAKQALSTSYNLHNLYGWSEMRSTAVGLRKLLGKRSFVLSRSTFTSSGQYGAHWTGDNKSGWSDLYYSISGILNFNMFGVPLVGADVCGFLGNENRELCIRWMQLGAFYPFMRNHASLHTKPQDPGSFDEEAITYMRDALEIRYSLLPFMYTCFFLSHMTGTPVVRPLFMLFPGTEALDKQFMWGDALLISPALDQGALSVDAYFPKGLWYDLYNGTLLKTVGEETLVLDAPLSTINAHIRGGSIIPCLPPAITTNEMRINPFILQVVPDEHSYAQGLLFWDDGESLDTVGLNQYTLLNFTLRGTTLTSTVIVANFIEMKLGVVHVCNIASKPESVILNGKSSVKFNYDAPTKVLGMYDLNIDLLTAFDLRWTL